MSAGHRKDLSNVLRRAIPSESSRIQDAAHEHSVRRTKRVNSVIWNRRTRRSPKTKNGWRSISTRRFSEEKIASKSQMRATSQHDNAGSCLSLILRKPKYPEIDNRRSDSAFPPKRLHVSPSSDRNPGAFSFRRARPVAFHMNGGDWPSVP